MLGPKAATPARRIMVTVLSGIPGIKSGANFSLSGLADIATTAARVGRSAMASLTPVAILVVAATAIPAISALSPTLGCAGPTLVDRLGATRASEATPNAARPRPLLQPGPPTPAFVRANPRRLMERTESRPALDAHLLVQVERITVILGATIVRLAHPASTGRLVAKLNGTGIHTCLRASKKPRRQRRGQAGADMSHDKPGILFNLWKSMQPGASASVSHGGGDQCREVRSRGGGDRLPPGGASDLGGCSRRGGGGQQSPALLDVWAYTTDPPLCMPSPFDACSWLDCFGCWNG